MSASNPFDKMFEPKVLYDDDGFYSEEELRLRGKTPISNDAVVDLQTAHDKFYEKAFQENKPVRREMIRDLAGVKSNEPI